MRGIFGLAGLLIALLIVGLLVKKQLAATQQAAPAFQRPPAQTPAVSIRQQSQQVEQQYKNALEGAMHKVRPALSDDSQ